MRYVSTRDNTRSESAAEAIARGIAPDGGLYTPQDIPALDGELLRGFADMGYAGRAAAVMGRYLDDFTAAELSDCAAAAYESGRFRDASVVPVTDVGGGVYILELFHGPTCAFKDVALQIMPQLLRLSFNKTGETRRACILVATSGDTGKAALEGFRDAEGTEIVVFYPDRGVSRVQELQMLTQEGGNVHVCGIHGNFDDAQRGVKAIFADPAMAAEMTAAGRVFSSANSINWGRLLPQVAYYASAYADMCASGAIQYGAELNVCVPTGNFGNILAAYLARRMGLPIGRLICASNANNVLYDFISIGVYDRYRAFYKTASPSMDILVSSNVERLLYYLHEGDGGMVAHLMRSLAESGRYGLSDAARDRLREDFSAGWCSEEETMRAIRESFTGRGYLLDPHTAVAMHVLADYREKSGDMRPCLVAATASPYKFCESVLTALGAEPQSGESPEDTLRRVSGAPVPEPVTALKNAVIRHDMRADKDDMAAALRRMLGLAGM